MSALPSRLPPNQTQSSLETGFETEFQTGYDTGFGTGPAVNSTPLNQRVEIPQIQNSTEGLGLPQYTVPRPYSRQQAPSYTRNTPNPDNPSTPTATPASLNTETGLFGPVGYDEQ